MATAAERTLQGLAREDAGTFLEIGGELEFRRIEVTIPGEPSRRFKGRWLYVERDRDSNELLSGVLETENGDFIAWWGPHGQYGGGFHSYANIDFIEDEQMRECARIGSHHMTAAAEAMAADPTYQPTSLVAMFG